MTIEATSRIMLCAGLELCPVDAEAEIRGTSIRRSVRQLGVARASAVTNWRGAMRMTISLERRRARPPCPWTSCTEWRRLGAPSIRITSRVERADDTLVDPLSRAGVDHPDRRSRGQNATSKGSSRRRRRHRRHTESVVRLVSSLTWAVRASTRHACLSHQSTVDIVRELSSCAAYASSRGYAELSGPSPDGAASGRTTSISRCVSRRGRHHGI